MAILIGLGKKRMKPNPNTLNIFTDGSKLLEGVGAGIYYVDSQAAIKAINSYEISSKNVPKSRKAGHKGIAGNEIVDKRAVYRPLQQEKGILKPLLKRRIERRWNSLATCKTAKIMCTQNATKDARFAVAPSRKQSRTIVDILTGHNLLAAHAYKIGITNNDSCRYCNELEERETLEHLLCSCHASARTKLKCLGALQHEKLEHLSGRELQSLLRFAKDVDVLQEVYHK